MPEPIIPPSALRLPEVSPTGTPVMPVPVVPVLTVLVAAATAGLAFLPEHTVLHKACVIVIAIGAVLGVASPGLRR